MIFFWGSTCQVSLPAPFKIIGLSIFVQGEVARELGGKNVTILHTFVALFQYYFCPWPKNGTFGAPGRPRPERGTMRPKYGMSREIRDGWQPYYAQRVNALGLYNYVYQGVAVLPGK